jgi:hypothetical protein
MSSIRNHTSHATHRPLTAAALAAALRARGVVVNSVMEPCSEHDGSLELSRRLHVQVGFQYFNLVLELQNGNFRFFPVRSHVDQLLADMRSTLN